MMVRAGQMVTEEPCQSLLEREGCRLCYWLSGPERGPRVVLTHGAGVDHHEFDGQTAALSERYRVLCWDVRGHGDSRPASAPFTIARALDDLVAILDHLGWARAVFAGHSMGGNLVQELVFNHSERVTAMVALDCTCNTLPLSALQNLLLAISPAMLSLFPYQSLKRLSANASSSVPAVREYLYAAFNQMPRTEFVSILNETTKCLHFEPGYRIEQPLLLMVGEFDKTGNISKIAPRWAVREPHCRFEIIPKAGHAANLDNPETVNKLMLEFLAAHAEAV